MNINAALLLALTMLASCTSQQPQASTEIFDEQSADTLLVAAPLVFARGRSDVAAYARDYATLVAVEDDRSGTYSEYLLLYRWSTVDPRMSSPPSPDAGALRILADGRSIDLMPMSRMPVGLNQHKALHIPSHGNAIARAYRVDVATLRFIATSRDLVVRMPDEALDTPFKLWEDGRRALVQFLERTSAP